MTAADLAVIRHMNRLTRVVFGASGKPPPSNPATVARAMWMMRRLSAAYSRARGRLGR